MESSDIHDRIREIRRETAELRRFANDRIERANEGIERADIRIAELQAALASCTSAPDAAWVKVDLQLATLAREQYVMLRKEADMRERIDRCDRELDELERSAP